MPAKKQSSREYLCSFCGTSQEQVHRLIAGPGGVYICNECIDLCREIIEEEQAGTPSPEPPVAESAAPGVNTANPVYDLEAILGPAALDARTKQLIYIAVLGALRNAPAVRAQIPAAIGAGATPAEIREALLVGIPATVPANVLSVYAEVEDLLKPPQD